VPPAPSTRTEADEWLPTLSVLYRVDSHWSVFANAGKSFGPQQYAQLAQSSNNQLYPESAKTYELGTHYKSDTWNGELTLFNIDFNKELFLTRVGTGNGIWTDLGATRHRGLESALRYDFGKNYPALKGLSLGMSYTFTQATSQAGPLQAATCRFIRATRPLSARYAMERWTFNADLNAQSKQRSPGTRHQQYITQEDANGNLGDIPGFAILGLRTSYQAGKELNNLRLTVGMKNVFDRRYFTRSTDNNGGKYVGMPHAVRAGHPAVLNQGRCKHDCTAFSVAAAAPLAGPGPGLGAGAGRPHRHPAGHGQPLDRRLHAELFTAPHRPAWPRRTALAPLYAKSPGFGDQATVASGCPSSLATACGPRCAATGAAPLYLNPGPDRSRAGAARPRALSTPCSSCTAACCWNPRARPSWPGWRWPIWCCWSPAWCCGGPGTGRRPGVWNCARTWPAPCSICTAWAAPRWACCWPSPWPPAPTWPGVRWAG
jgi:hypothetical protein